MHFEGGQQIFLTGPQDSAKVVVLSRWVEPLRWRSTWGRILWIVESDSGTCAALHAVRGPRRVEFACRGSEVTCVKAETFRGGLRAEPKTIA